MNTTNSVLKKHSFSIGVKLPRKLSTASDFGIPQRLVPVLMNKIREHKNLRHYLAFLLDRLRSGNLTKRLPVFIGPKTEYQEIGQDLEYFQFRPFIRDWIELMTLAKARGGSATLLFVLLFQLDAADSGKTEIGIKFEVKNGVRTFSKRIHFLQTLNFRTGFWRRVLKCGRSSYRPPKKRLANLIRS